MGKTLQIWATYIAPSTNAAMHLGAAGTAWGNLFLAGTASLNVVTFGTASGANVIAGTGSFINFFSTGTSSLNFVTFGTISGSVAIAGTGSFVNLFATALTCTGGTAGVQFVGERAYITGSFTSAAATLFVPCPFAGKVVDVITTCDTTPVTCSGFTLKAGSAGTVGVATVALAFATAIGQQVRPALTAFAITTASAFGVVVTTAGTAANFGFTIVLEKTA